MAVRGLVAPPRPWSQELVEPHVDATAQVHSYSRVIGDVHVGDRAIVAPGSTIRADQGGTFAVGQGTSIQDGVVINGLKDGRVLGDNGKEYSVWIGRQTSITHMSLIHGPAYVGDNCFIGFRSTVFNARIGQGCIVMMHALIQDVEIPPGRYVPSGAVITTQRQADRLPEVQPQDVELASQLAGNVQSLHAGFRFAENFADASPTGGKSGKAVHAVRSEEKQSMTTMTSGRLSAQTVDQVRHLLAQGYQIGTEHADKRRFRANAWNSCSPIAARRDADVLSALEACLAEHDGEYVRLVGIDAKAKRRVLEEVIQRPDGSAASNGNGGVSIAHSAQSVSASSPQPTGEDWVSHVQQLLGQGYQVSAEYADKRRFRANAWNSCGTVHSSRGNDVVAAIQACMSEHPNDYVRLIGVDPNAKRRVSEVVVQRPGASAAPAGRASSGRSSSNSYGGGTQTVVNSGGGHLGADVVTQVRQLLSQGLQIGAEVADKRRFRANAWNSVSLGASGRDAEIVSALEACIADNANGYVRLVGVDPNAKRRVTETVIHRPGEGGQGFAPSSNGQRKARGSASQSYSAAAPAQRASGGLSPEVVDQVRQLLAQGHKVTSEHADKRRFRANAWTSCSPIQSSRDSEVLAALESCIAEHPGEYVRIIGVDTKAKRRVLELVIQRP